MSLINDALKRAKEAQAKAPLPEAAIPHLRPVEAAPSGWRGVGLLLPVVLTLVALGGLFFLWQAAPNNTRADNSLAPSPAPAPVGTRFSVSPTAAENPGRGETRPHQNGPSAPLAAAAPTNVPASAAASPTTVALGSVAAPGVSTNVSAPTTPPAPKPAVLRLQAIVYHPSRPSAMISGKTVFVGDHVGGLRVAAITRESALLVGPTCTNLLSLEP